MPVLSVGRKGASGPLLFAWTPASTLGTILAICLEDQRPHESSPAAPGRPGHGREPVGLPSKPQVTAHTRARGPAQSSKWPLF